jgi:hypothetical protein
MILIESILDEYACMVCMVLVLWIQWSFINIVVSICRKEEEGRQEDLPLNTKVLKMQK